MTRRDPHTGPAYWYAVQLAWIAQCGGTLGGYILNYLSHGETDVERIVRIWQADQAQLEKLRPLAARGRW